VRRAVVVGRPRDAILGAADRTDGVVVGAHAGRITHRQFIGSTTLHLLRCAACDVLVVPAGFAGGEGQERAEPEPPVLRSLGRAR
jgi:nucleotide-binding universal stress UspA family protein